MLAYVLGGSLYLNITNRCTNDCTFCIRKTSQENGLWLSRDPSTEELIEAVGDPRGFSELVFCGFGEPLLRHEVVLDVARYLRPFGVPLRLDTNGVAELATGSDLSREMAGWIDSVSVSLVAQDAETYVQLTRCQYGVDGYRTMLDFARRCLDSIPRVEMSVVMVDGVDVKRCREIARSMGARFLAREYRREFRTQPREVTA